MALGLCSSGWVEASSDAEPSVSERGRLVVGWTINGLRDPDQRDQGDAEAADAVLVDARGAERTTVVDLQSFDTFGGDELDIPIDFPASSFR
jgi:hypothetical protein